MAAGHSASRIAGGVAIALCCALPSSAQQKPEAPPAGFSLGLTYGAGWNSNPLELTGRRKGDAFLGSEIIAGYRWNLWDGATLAVSATAFSELYGRETGGGINRLAFGATISQKWGDTTLTLGASTRTAANQHLTAHDSASSDLSLGLSHPVKLTDSLTLIANTSLARRFMNDGTEDQWRSRFGLTLARKWEKWTFRLGGSFGHTIEDKTPILPRINDRSLGAFIAAAYEWEKDREVTMRLGYTRMYSSYPADRYQAFSFSPQVSATLRF